MLGHCLPPTSPRRGGPGALTVTGRPPWARIRLAGTSGDSSVVFVSLRGVCPGPRSSERTRREPLGAAWNGEVEAQPPPSPAGPTSGQGVLRDSEPWLPALGGRSSLFAAVSTLGAVLHEPKVRCFLYIAMWIGSQRDLILNRGSRLRGSGFRGAGPPRSWHTLPLFHVPSASLGALEAPRSASLGRTRAASGAASASRTSPNLSLPEFNSLPSIRWPLLPVKTTRAARDLYGGGRSVRPLPT